MLEAVTAADNDDHLEAVAAGLAEHILAHYGSMIPLFEKQARKDRRFKRMLTGVWRNRMSDDVWLRLRTIQSDVPDPLSNMLPLQHGVEYMSDNLSKEDRQKADKGRFVRDSQGIWRKQRSGSAQGSAR